MHLLPCPNCQETVLVSPSQAGDSTHCKSCDASIDIPKLGELRKLPSAAPDLGSDASSKNNIRSENSTGRRIASTLLGCIAVMAVISAAYCGFRWASIEPSSSTEEYLATYREQYPIVESAVLIREYEDMEKISLDFPMPYKYKVSQNAKDHERNKAIGSGVVALITSILSIVIASTGRTSDN